MGLAKRIFVIPHFHYDVAWITTERQNLDKVYKILETVIEIMREDEDFKYVVDQAFYLEKMKIEKPKLFSNITDKVHEGKIEVVNAGYVMPDLNLTSPYVIKKNYEIMNNFAEKEFGVKPKVAWMIDCFGHPGIMPKIAKESGLKYYVFWRGMNKSESSQDFTWRGTDGTDILAHWMKRGYSLFGYDFRDLTEAVRSLDPVTDLVFIPFGCDFCIPHEVFRKQVHKIKEAKFALPSEFFKELEKHVKELSIVKGEMLSDRSNFKGYYSSRISFKQLYRNAEKEILRKEADEEEWKNLIYGSSHDFISGTGIDKVYRNAEEKLKRIKLTKDNMEKKTHYEGKFLDKIFFMLEAEEGDLYHTIPSIKSTLPKNAVKLRTYLKDSTLDLNIQTDFQFPRYVLSLIIKTGIRNGTLIHYFSRDVFTERALNSLHSLNGFFKYKDQNDNEFSFCNNDCFNYKVKHDGDVHIVLVRSVQILSHGDAGPTIPCPNALELGKHRFRIILSMTDKKKIV